MFCIDRRRFYIRNICVDPEIEKKLYNINDIKDPKERFNLLVKQWEPMMKRTPYTWLFNLTGNPAITLPVYKSANNLPLGVMFAAQDNSEKILLEMGKHKDRLSYHLKVR